MNIKILILLSFGHLVTDVSQGALPALLPFLKEALGLSYTAAGVVLLLSNLTSSIIQPLFGLISDRQPKPFLIPLGILMAAVGISLSGLSPNYPTLLLLVIFCGLGVAAFHPEGFKTAHFFIGQRKASGMSLFAVGGNLGFALGPFTLVFLVTHFDLKGTLFYLIPGLLMVATVIWFLSTFRYDHPIAEKKAASPDRKGRSSYSLLTLLILIVTMRSWIQMGLVSYIPFYYINYLKGDPLLAGKMVTTFLVSGTVGTLIGAPLADRWGHKRFLTLTMAVVTPLLFLFLNMEGWGVFPVLGPHGLRPDRHLLGYRGHGPGPAARPAGPGLRADGRVCHRHRRVGGHAPGHRGRCLGRTDRPPDPGLHAPPGPLALSLPAGRSLSPAGTVKSIFRR